VDALLCRNCSWFGIYREDVTERIRGCPICGSTQLSVRDVEDEDWHELGRRLVESVPEDEPRPG
jgi:hypothetical protein